MAKFPSQKDFMTINTPNPNKNITININSVEFEYNIAKCEINYLGTVLNATPNFESYVTTIDFFDLSQLRKVIGPLNFLKLDQVYKFIEPRKNRPQSSKSPVPFLPFYETYRGDIYYSDDHIDTLTHKIEQALTSLNITFTKNGFNYYISEQHNDTEISIYLTDEEDGYIIEMINLNSREFNDTYWNFKNKWAFIMQFIKEVRPYPFYTRPILTKINTSDDMDESDNLASVLPPFVEFPSNAK
jgi:hypothetical protein